MRFFLLSSAALLPVLLACSGVLESAQMKRAREFVAASEFESARQELRVQLHNSPDDQHAKALLLFMQLAESASALGDVSGAAQCLLLAPLADGTASTAEEEALKQAKLHIRKGQLDLGVPTVDWDEYASALAEAVAYGWTKHEFSSDNLAPKLTFAFCAALQGDSTGVAYLVDHLAQDESRPTAQSYLYLLGESASGHLELAAHAPENLASAFAGDTLRDLHLVQELGAISARHKDRLPPMTVRAEGREGKSGNSAKFLMRLGWRDDNQGLQDVFDAALARESLAKLLIGKGAKEPTEAPVVVRLASVAETNLAVFTVAIPSSQSTEVALDIEGGDATPLLPAGINTTFLTEVRRWDGRAWKAIPIGDKPSVSGPDLALLAVNGSEEDALLSPDQVAFLVYRGVAQERRVVRGWYGPTSQTVQRARIDRQVFHLGATSLEPVKTTDVYGVELGPDGLPVATERAPAGEFALETDGY